MSINIQAFKVLDDFISEENKVTGTSFYRDESGNISPDDVVFTDSTVNYMAISLNALDECTPMIFYYDKKFRDLAERLKNRLFADTGLVYSLEDWSFLP